MLRINKKIRKKAKKNTYFHLHLNVSANISKISTDFRKNSICRYREKDGLLFSIIKTDSVVFDIFALFSFDF